MINHSTQSKNRKNKISIATLSLLIIAFVYFLSYVPSFGKDTRNNIDLLPLGLYGGYKAFKSDNFKNFDFIIYQLNPKTPITDILNDAMDNNYDIIWRFPLPEGTSRESPPDSDKWSKLIIKTFKSLSKSNTIKISLYEETTPWGQWKNLLIDTFKKVKIAIPNIEICQWYSNTKKDSAPGRTAWPILPADCLIWNQYHYGEEQYERYVLSITNDFPKIKKYSLIWLSPNWEYGVKRRSINDEFWTQKKGKERSSNQIRINQKYNIPTSFFAYSLIEKKGTSNQPALLWEGNDRDQAFWLQLEKSITKFREGKSNFILPDLNKLKK